MHDVKSLFAQPAANGKHMSQSHDAFLAEIPVLVVRAFRQQTLFHGTAGRHDPRLMPLVYQIAGEF